MIITVDELQKTTLYEEITDAITRNDDTVIEMQILAAQSLCATYLFKYNLKPVFGDDTVEPVVAPTKKCPALANIVKIIACYYLLRQSNPNVAIELYKEDYDQAIKLLEDLRDGNNQLSELEYAEDDPETPYDESKANGVSFSSNPKRQNFF